MSIQQKRLAMQATIKQMLCNRQKHRKCKDKTPKQTDSERIVDSKLHGLRNLIFWR